MILISSKLPLAMAVKSSLQASLSLEIISDEGRQILRRQGSLTPGNSSPKVDWRASGTSSGQGRSTIRRAQSVGSALSEFPGSRKSFEEKGAMRRSGSRGCLDSLEAKNNARASLDVDDGWSDWVEEDREWNFATLDTPLRPGGRLHRDTFPSPLFVSRERQSFDKAKGDSFHLPRGGTQVKRTSSTGGHKLTIPKKSIVLEQAQESFDLWKDRLESSLRRQPECSYTPNAVVEAPVHKDEGVLGLAKDVGRLKLCRLPRSLKLCRLPRSLKRRKLHKESCSMSNAFTALVFIIKSMHGHALEMQEDHVLQLLTPTQRDMHLSFAWLFQQVFASTPEYMLSIMTLLGEFTVHALGADLALAAASASANPCPPSATTVVREDVAAGLRKELNRRHKGVHAIPAKPENLPRAIGETLPEIRMNWGDANISSEEKVMKDLLAEAMKEMEAYAGWQPLPVVEKGVGKKLVAPVQVSISPDNYTCFDRTELEYQHAISSQPANVMLLSNYAQFLYVVRHDISRAEEYFHRAIRADPADPEVLGRFATFLWLARGDKETAERAFCVAAALDPSNPHHAGEYSHFLWHSEEARYCKCSSATCFVEEAS